jgi:hypothetical protein
MSAVAERLNDRLVGTWQQPKNRWQGAPNSIHTDSVAKKVGMRGGTIPGTVHLSHFRPIMTELFGDRWLKSGSVSMFYTYATIDQEDVRAIVKLPPEGVCDDIHLDAWVENKEGRTVCKGTVSVGHPKTISYVRGLAFENAAPGIVRILKDMKVGVEIPAVENFIVEKGGENGELRDPQEMYGALQIFPREVKTAPAVGFFGATEVRLHNGPIKLGTPYRKTGRVVCVGDSPKTEFAWFDSEFHDKDGKLIADMRHMTRWMKVSSPLWAGG